MVGWAKLTIYSLQNNFVFVYKFIIRGFELIFVGLYIYFTTLN